MYSKKAKYSSDIAFCYPPNPEYKPPIISGMYYFYHTYAKNLCGNLVRKEGDLDNYRMHLLNLM
jgi:hypothetical protein